MKTLRGECCYCPHFADKETEAQRGGGATFSGALGQLLISAPPFFRGWNKSWREISTPACLAGTRFATMMHPICSKGLSESFQRLCSLLSTSQPSLWCPVSVPSPWQLGEGLRFDGLGRGGKAVGRWPVPCDFKHVCVCVYIHVHVYNVSDVCIVYPCMCVLYMYVHECVCAA